MTWSPESWRELPARQQPEWPDPAHAAEVCAIISGLPPLTSPARVDALSEQLRRVHAGQAFIVQAGDCAEPFGSTAVQGIHGKHRIITHMARTVHAAAGIPVVPVGRVAGQFAKPRSESTELVDGVRLPAFRGLIVNGPEATEASRRPDPQRMLTAYHTSRAVVAELGRIHAAQPGPDGPGATGATTDHGTTGQGTTGAPAGGSAGPAPADLPLWTSHEALLLEYEQALTRRHPDTGEWYLLSTDLPWIGERTRQLDGAHVAFLGAVANPVACKVGPDTGTDEVLALCAALHAGRRPGRLTLIPRMGAGLVRERLAPLVRAVHQAGYPVVWVCDPMHGNATRTASGRKTRRVADIVDELCGFVEVLRAAGGWPGGVHLEVAGDDVTECLWPDDQLTDEDMARAYRSLCDARLNNAQAVYVVERLAEALTGGAPVDAPADASAGAPVTTARAAVHPGVAAPLRNRPTALVTG